VKPIARRAKQVEYNAKRGITPIGISKSVHDMIEGPRLSRTCSWS